MAVDDKFWRCLVAKDADCQGWLTDDVSNYLNISGSEPLSQKGLQVHWISRLPCSQIWGYNDLFICKFQKDHFIKYLCT